MQWCSKITCQNGPLYYQKAITLAKLIVEEVIPIIGVPEALLSDRGTNLMSHLVQDVCDLLGTKKLHITAYQPQCDGLVEKFNRTLKIMLRKQAARYVSQWDQFLPGVLWAYRNTPMKQRVKNRLIYYSG